ncbi:type II toxin-antitoxin system HicA family toxin [Halopseudomonas xiamenensis]
MRSRQVIGLLIEHGWYEVAVKGSHHQFKHPERPGRVTVPPSILKQAGIK